MWNNYLVMFEAAISMINVVSLLIIVFFLEKNLRTNWILKDELNMFSVLLFLSLGGLLLREILFLFGIIGSYFVGALKSFEMITSTTPWLIINSLFSIALLGTAILIAFKDFRLFVINKSGKIWFRLNKNKGDADS